MEGARALNLPISACLLRERGSLADDITVFVPERG